MYSQRVNCPTRNSYQVVRQCSSPLVPGTTKGPDEALEESSAEGDFPDQGPLLFGKDFASKAKSTAHNVKGFIPRKTSKGFSGGRDQNKRKLFQPQGRCQYWGTQHHVAGQRFSVFNRLIPIFVRTLQSRSRQTSTRSKSSTTNSGKHLHRSRMGYSGFPATIPRRWLSITRQPQPNSCHFITVDTSRKESPFHLQLEENNLRLLAPADRSGYCIELLRPPQQTHYPVTVVPKEQEALIQEEITQLQLKGAIVPVHVKDNQRAGFCLTIFLVPKKEPKQMRPVVNLKPLNRFLPKVYFKMEGVQMIRDLLQKEDWMCRIDLKDVYFAIPVCKAQKQKALQQTGPHVSSSQRGSGVVASQGIEMEWEELEIETDASLTGWGAYCQGILTGGRWSEEEQSLHINQLELLAALFALRAFLKHAREVSVLLKSHNVTTVVYINHLGGTKSQMLVNIAKELWRWCLQRRTALKAQHLPGKDNLNADFMSCHLRDRTNWILNPSLFSLINQMWGPLQLDLFATRFSCQLPRFFKLASRPRSGGYRCILSGLGELGLCPPAMVPHYSSPGEDPCPESDVGSVTPCWPTQPWFPQLWKCWWIFGSFFLIQPNSKWSHLPPTATAQSGHFHFSWSHGRSQETAPSRRDFRRIYQLHPCLMEEEDKCLIQFQHGGSGRDGAWITIPIPFRQVLSASLNF